MVQLLEGQSGLPCPESTLAYWHTEPSEALLGHKTTPELPATADVVIVGSGITGSFAAHFLKNSPGARVESVVLLEAREACWGATGRNGGHCQPMLYAGEPEVAAFELENYRFLKDLVLQHEIPCDWVSFSGIHAYLTDTAFAVGSSAVKGLQKTHPDLASQIEVVHSDEAGGSSRLASLRIPDAKGAILQQNAASLWPYKLVVWVLERLLREFPAEQFNLQTNTPVISVTKRPQQEPSDGFARWEVNTRRGSILAKTVLLCTNGYTSRLLPAFSDLIVPMRGQVAALIPPKPVPSVDPATLEHSYVFVGDYPPPILARDDYLVQRPLPSEELIFGGGRFMAKNRGLGEWRDNEVEESVSNWLKEELSPPLDLRQVKNEGVVQNSKENRLEASYEWTGIMAYSRDHHPWVGPVPESLGGGEGLWLCGGYSGHGMPVAALSARAVVRQINSGTEGLNSLGGLPASFKITEERVEYVRTNLEAVKEQDLKGGFTGVLAELLQSLHR